MTSPHPSSGAGSVPGGGRAMIPPMDAEAQLRQQIQLQQLHQMSLQHGNGYPPQVAGQQIVSVPGGYIVHPHPAVYGMQRQQQTSIPYMMGHFPQLRPEQLHPAGRAAMVVPQVVGGAAPYGVHPNMVQIPHAGLPIHHPAVVAQQQMQHIPQGVLPQHHIQHEGILGHSPLLSQPIPIHPHLLQQGMGLAHPSMAPVMPYATHPSLVKVDPRSAIPSPMLGRGASARMVSPMLVVPNSGGTQALLALPQGGSLPMAVEPAAGGASLDPKHIHDKKILKRAANRKSAQLSRQRKKAYIDELRTENEELKRQEEILQVVPDPVFAFNAADGKVWFASKSAAAQFGLDMDFLMQATFFDLVTTDCSNRLKNMISKGLAANPNARSMLLQDLMTVRFRKEGKEGNKQTLLGELSGRLSRQDPDIVHCVCSVRLLSLMYDEHRDAEKKATAAATGYNGDQSTSDMDQDGSQGSSSEDCTSVGSGPGSGGSGSGISPPHYIMGGNSVLPTLPTSIGGTESYSDSISQGSGGHDGDDDEMSYTDTDSSSNNGSVQGASSGSSGTQQNKHNYPVESGQGKNANSTSSSGCTTNSGSNSSSSNRGSGSGGGNGSSGNQSSETGESTKAGSSNKRPVQGGSTSSSSTNTSKGSSSTPKNEKGKASESGTSKRHGSHNRETGPLSKRPRFTSSCQSVVPAPTCPGQQILNHSVLVGVPVPTPTVHAAGHSSHSTVHAPSVHVKTPPPTTTHTNVQSSGGSGSSSAGAVFSPSTSKEGPGADDVNLHASVLDSTDMQVSEEQQNMQASSSAVCI